MRLSPEVITFSSLLCSCGISPLSGTGSETCAEEICPSLGTDSQLDFMHLFVSTAM